MMIERRRFFYIPTIMIVTPGVIGIGLTEFGIIGGGIAAVIGVIVYFANRRK